MDKRPGIAESLAGRNENPEPDHAWSGPSWPQGYSQLAQQLSLAISLPKEIAASLMPSPKVRYG